MTPEEQRRGETLDDRLAREVPEGRRPSDTSTPAGQLVDDGGEDVEDELVADMATGPREDSSQEGTLIDFMGADEDLASAEEQAVRVDEEAPGATDDASDGYVQEGDA